MDEDAPLTWHLREDRAGAGVLYDLGSHGVDLARYLIGEPVSVTADMRSLLMKATDQNFVPVVDDKGDFIGIVTRRAIMRYWLDNLCKEEET